MGATDSGEPKVEYTVKQLLGMLEERIVGEMQDIKVELREIKSRLDDKASIRALRELEERFERQKEAVDLRFRTLEQTRAGGLAIGKVGMWLIGSVGVGVFVACVTLIAAAISGGHL